MGGAWSQHGANAGLQVVPSVCPSFFYSYILIVIYKIAGVIQNRQPNPQRRLFVCSPCPSPLAVVFSAVLAPWLSLSLPRPCAPILLLLVPFLGCAQAVCTFPTRPTTAHASLAHCLAGRASRTRTRACCFAHGHACHLRTWAWAQRGPFVSHVKGRHGDKGGKEGGREGREGTYSASTFSSRLLSFVCSCARVRARVCVCCLRVSL